MPRLDRYILLKYLKTFLMAMALIIVIVITFDVSEKLDDFLNGHAPLGEIVYRYYLNFIPGFVNLYSPLFILSEDIVRGVFVCCTGSKCGRQLLIRKDLQKTEEHEAGLNGIHCRQ